MTPEEKFVRGIWEALKRIKENMLYAKIGEPVSVSSSLIDERALNKLKEWGAIKIRENPWKYPASTKNVFYLEIIQPKFDEIYSKQKQPEEKIDYNNKFYAEIRAKEIRRQFDELNERRKELEELRKQIYSRIQKDFSAPFQYLKYYEEVSKKISEQLAPLKDALEKVGRAQQTVRISLTPALQRLAPSLKQLEEQIKNFNELYKAPDYSLSEAIISPDLIRVRQGAEMISELREVRKLIEKSAITKDEPISIKGELKIEGLKEGLEAIAKTKKEEDKNKFPYKLPAGTVWENIIFQFLNDENVFIKVGQHKYYTNYKEMGLVGKGKNPNPSELWTFLKVLALENGEIPIDNLKRETKYKKQKELLSKFLQSYFGINLDPFYPYKPYPPYKHERSYKIRMTLIPPPQSAKKQNDFNEEDKNDLGIEEDYKQQTPEIYDKDQ